MCIRDRYQRRVRGMSCRRMVMRLCWLVLLLDFHGCVGLVPVDSTMSTFGVAIKAHLCSCTSQGCAEQELFSHNISDTATHGVITQMWHAGTSGDPRMRVYVDDEIGGPSAAVDYPVALAHGLAPEDNGTYPFQSEIFGHTHNMGWYNTYQIPFSKAVRVTMQCSEASSFWFRVGGAQNLPISIGNLQLPAHSRLHVMKYDQTIGMGGLVTLASANQSGLLAQVNMFVRSSTAYQEGCMQANVDGRKLWISSGLEDFFLGSYFHTMPQMELGMAGFHLSNSTTCASKGNGPNSLAAYRIMHADPVLFSHSFQLQWQPHGNQPELAKAGYPISCNGGWPQSAGLQPVPGPLGDTSVGVVDLTTLSWVYLY
eukprot:TRINITY_DN9350_c0_g1_i1.p1 TRINITY_DN9350_c0_g1~~TRINITY_DN9350_c0_g1_i1.p1  ORF type:complete len:369 (-),score=83.37 TRINITY_DN9350_c0_g1_i1:119-1225(-)